MFVEVLVDVGFDLTTWVIVAVTGSICGWVLGRQKR